MEYGFKAEKVARSLGDSSQTLTTIYNRIGITYYNLEDELNALEFFKKGLAVAVRNNDEDGTLYLTGNVLNILLLRKRSIAKSMLPELDSIVTRGSAKSIKPIPYSEICRTYLHVGNAGRAKFFLDQLLEFQKSKPLSPSEEMPVYRAAYEYYYYLKDFRTARRYLDQEAVLAHRSLDTRRLQGIYQSRYKLDSVDGNYKSAFENLKKFKTYTDSTAANKARNELQTLTVRYQLEMKNDEIKLKSDNIKLLTKDNDAQKALLHRADVIRNITIAAIVLLIMLLAALYSRWNANRRNSIIIANKNQRLEQLVREKEWLVKEIHHRVKNNLQTIISLLETQAAFLRDDALSAVLDSQHRIHAMSLIHQKLYLVDTSTSIDMRPYVEELVHYLADSFDPNAKIEIALDVDHVLLDVSRAIPVGLIVNEAVTNAMKYAYLNRETGVLQVSLKQSPGKRIELRIQDDGIGMPPTMDNVRPSSLGMRLMKGLANEISGELAIESRHGTAVSLIFPLNEPIVTTPERPF
ncbi:sensor histidine kinase [Dyadobacter sp. 50-39]|uniref:sensor histidine kinase n=1 Tax=Dyadobacter sp. 50-39 TaxID=1895756 RepID=UPI0025B9C6AF|nr:sensor histidine kinase [Dyadobacter sp. 50-39]